MPRSVTIHIIGGGFGESIILSLPNGKIGVIDCYSPTLKVNSLEESRKSNPTLRFLRSHLKADHLAFLAFTHPHEDHGRGISHILEDYRNEIDEIWIFDAFQDLGIDRYFMALFDGKRKLPIEAILNEEPGTFSEELLQIRNQVLEQVDIDNPNRAILRLFSDVRLVNAIDEQISFFFLGPSASLAQYYKSCIVENLKDVVDADGRVVNCDWDHTDVNHNLASPAILCQYGATRILLGGDMEEVGWDEAIRDDHLRVMTSPCHFVKVSHHGSSTGYTKDLYKRTGVGKWPLAALTPFNRHKYPLPKAEGVSLLAGCVSDIWTTSIEAANRSRGFIEPLNLKELTDARSVLEAWRRTIEANPAFLGALDPNAVQELGIVTTARPVTAVPNDWIPDLLANPRLVALLQPELRSSFLPKPAKSDRIEDDHRLSFSFDDVGNEIAALRYIGKNCGQLN